MFIGCEIGTLGWVPISWTVFIVYGRMLVVNDGILDREYL